MRKLLAILLVCCLCLSLTACGVSIDKFEDNLGRKYDVEDFGDLDDYAVLMDVDMDDFDVEDAIKATHKQKGYSVVIIECGSKKAAKELEEACEGLVDWMEDNYSDEYSFDAVVKGKFVLVGEENAIEDALGK